jgi:NAD(P)-dependent dehydrogenase (short-subunit alcohol dehydrogenase family)
MTFEQNLIGRRAVITGGHTGLGRAIADRLAASGAAITIIDLPSALATATIPDTWQAHGVDLADAGCQDKLRSIAQGMGQVDIVIANAGMVPPWRGMADLDSAEWQRVMTLNVWGVAATLGAFAAALAQSPFGSAVVMASINGYKAHPKQVLYTASKHAAIGVMRAAALDMGAAGTRVNALAPGPIATPALVDRIDARHAMGGPSRDTALAELAAQTPLGRIATPEQVANTAHFLVSDAAAGLTGLVVPVAAGLV